MSRSIFCSTCKKEKEPGREIESRCKSCKSEANKAKRLKARLEKGLRPLGFGRSPNCYACGTIKENPKIGYCLACHRKKDNEWRLATGRTKRHRTGLCRCGNKIAAYSKCYCFKCASLWRKKYLEKNPEIKQKMYKKWDDTKFESFDEYVKYVARYTAANAIKRGMLVKMPCEICGITESIDAHHDDYSRALDVRWLCKKHHMEHHKSERDLNFKGDITCHIPESR